MTDLETRVRNAIGVLADAADHHFGGKGHRAIIDDLGDECGLVHPDVPRPHRRKAHFRVTVRGIPSRAIQAENGARHGQCAP